MPAQPPTGPEIDQLKQALLDAFTLDKLRQLLRIQLDVDLEHLVPTIGQSGHQIAYNLVRAYAATPGGLACSFGPRGRKTPRTRRCKPS